MLVGTDLAMQTSWQEFRIHLFTVQTQTSFLHVHRDVTNSSCTELKTFYIITQVSNVYRFVLSILIHYWAYTHN